jgi:hypothetical protein
MARQAAIMKRVRWYDARVRWAARQSAAAQARWVWSNVARRGRKLLKRVGVRTGAPAAAPVRTHDTLDRLGRDIMEVAGEQVLRRQAHAVGIYIPQPYAGAIDLVFAEERPDIVRFDPTRGWRRVADEVHVHSIVAHHLDLITNKLPELAGVLRTVLERETR